MAFGIADTFIFFVTEKEGTIQHIRFFRAGEPRVFVIAFRNDSICMVYTDFCTGIDTVLSFPEFDQPGSASIVEIDREGIETI